MIKDLDYYMSLSYRIEIIEDKEEGGYALHCPELTGCITCAETLEEGFEMIKDAKKCWFEACLEDGIEIPEPREYNSFFDERFYNAYTKLTETGKKKAMVFVNDLLSHELVQA